jgi:hypothetical protein
MALPRIDAPTYSLMLPVSKIEIRFRPFLVKEQKILLMAMEANDKQAIENNVHQILQNCILNDIDLENLPLVDIEYFFLQLRARSVGEIVDSKYKCENVVNDKPCGNVMQTSFNLLDLKVNFSENQETDIKLSNNVGIKLKYPTFKVTKNLNQNDSVTKSAFEILVDCIDFIYDSDSVYYAHETPRQELMEFLESLTKEQFGKIEQFIQNMPKLNKNVDIKCSKCGYEHHLDIEGLQSFFE